MPASMWEALHPDEPDCSSMRHAVIEEDHCAGCGATENLGITFDGWTLCGKCERERGAADVETED